MPKKKKRRKKIRKKIKKRRRRKLIKNKKIKSPESPDLIFKVPKKWAKKAYVDKKLYEKKYKL